MGSLGFCLSGDFLVEPPALWKSFFSNFPSELESIETSTYEWKKALDYKSYCYHHTYFSSSKANI